MVDWRLLLFILLIIVVKKLQISFIFLNMIKDVFSLLKTKEKTKFIKKNFTCFMKKNLTKMLKIAIKTKIYKT